MLSTLLWTVGCIVRQTLCIGRGICVVIVVVVENHTSDIKEQQTTDK